MGDTASLSHADFSRRLATSEKSERKQRRYSRWFFTPPLVGLSLTPRADWLHRQPRFWDEPSGEQSTWATAARKPARALICRHHVLSTDPRFCGSGSAQRCRGASIRPGVAGQGAREPAATCGHMSPPPSLPASNPTAPPLARI